MTLPIYLRAAWLLCGTVALIAAIVLLAEDGQVLPLLACVAGWLAGLAVMGRK